MIGAVSAALGGVQAASRQFDRAAGAVASAPAGPADLLGAVTDTLAAQDSLAVNVAVLRSTLRAEKQVLDILV